MWQHDSNKLLVNVCHILVCITDSSRHMMRLLKGWNVAVVIVPLQNSWHCSKACCL